MSGISPKLPLTRDSDDGYRLTKTLKEVARQNLKMLILTSPGERIMIPNFGVGLRNYLFENITDELLFEIRSKIIEQAREYLPYIVINSVNFRQEDRGTNGLSVEPSSTSNYLHVVIDFTIDSEFTSETLIINL
jgi:phage baseplate assembly protein W|tara:strand:- start:2289 stop:2690 length:402 start_codon:yes stop_codon:yes gene_type:complete